ncbi:alpha/beta-hydrolase [Clavulina sp. PMI_390]|nr:alpha/beta-hydrolase [Clavulina sp. PMI_390]
MTNTDFLHLHQRLHGDQDSANAALDELLEEAQRTHPEAPTSPITHPAPEQLIPPVVLVEGFFSFFDSFFWGPIETHLNASRTSRGLKGSRRVIFARTGPVSSMFDRACELYYAIKGGRVDYGEQHARLYGHLIEVSHKKARYGRNYEQGLYPSWSPEHPIHFVAHSLGGTTVTVMQILIAEGHFPGAHPDMVASVNTVGSPFRGTAYPYILGKSYENSLDTRFFSIDSLITKSVHVLSWFKPLIPQKIPLPDWLADSRGLTMGEMSIFKLMSQLWKSDWGEGRDVISFDATFEGAKVYDDRWKNPSPNTYYRSYAMCMTKRENSLSPYHVASYKSPLLESIFLYSFSKMLGKFDYRTIRPLPWFYKVGPVPRPTLAPHLPSSEPLADGHVPSPSSSSSATPIDDVDVEIDRSMRAPLRATGVRIDLGEDYYANDGVVPLFSQWHPGDCSPSRCLHHSTLNQPHPSPFFFGLPPTSYIFHPSSPSSGHYSLGLGRDGWKARRSASVRAAMKPGIWNVCHIPDSTHVSMMPLWLGTQRQKEFWIEIGSWMERVDEAREELRDVSSAVGTSIPMDVIEEDPEGSLSSDDEKVTFGGSHVGHDVTKN